MLHFPDDKKDTAAYKSMEKCVSILKDLFAGSDWLISDVMYLLTANSYSLGKLAVHVVHKSMDGRYAEIEARVDLSYRVRQFVVTFNQPIIEIPDGPIVTFRQPSGISKYANQAPKNRCLGNAYATDQASVDETMLKLEAYLLLELKADLEKYSTAYTEWKTRSKKSQEAVLESLSAIEYLNRLKPVSDSKSRMSTAIHLTKYCALSLTMNPKGLLNLTINGPAKSASNITLKLLKNLGKVIDKQAVTTAEKWFEAYECEL